jgi:hypothetical protein
MKRIMSVVAAGAVALGGVALLGGGAATADTTTTTSTTTTTLGPPIQGTSNLPLYLNVDTVVGGGVAAGVPKPAVGCALTNEFFVGQTVVFRMSGVNVATGGTPLTPANVASATVTIPGLTAPLVMGYGNHGTVAFWSLGWNTTGYKTLGVVPFKLTVTTVKVPAVTKRVRVKLHNGKYVMRTKIVRRAVPGQSYTYTQAGTAVTSQLTLNAVA